MANPFKLPKSTNVNRHDVVEAERLDFESMTDEEIMEWAEAQPCRLVAVTAQPLDELPF